MGRGGKEWFLIEFPLAAAAAGVTFALGFLTAKVLEGRPKRNALNAGNTGGSPYAPDDPWSEVVHDNFEEPARWEGLLTKHGLEGDLVVSSLQKEIRRSHTDNAARLALELLSTCPAAEDKLWQRLLVISVEDIGMANHMAPVVVHNLRQMAKCYNRNEGERALFAIHAVRLLCEECLKDRTSDEMLWYLKDLPAGPVETTQASRLPEIPEYAEDMHTHRGKKKLGSGVEAEWHFLNEGTKLDPALEARTMMNEKLTSWYRTQLLASLHAKRDPTPLNGEPSGIV